LAATTSKVFSATPRKAKNNAPLNIVYLFSDEHRWHSMSFTEQPGLQTPTMERMTTEGVEFTNCISNYPVCSPHRAMLLTSRWPYQQGVIDNDIPLSSNEVTIGKIFKQAGYRTAYIGKWHLGGVRAEPFGFDLSLIWTNTNSHWDEGICHPLGKDPVQPKGYGATRVTDQALEFIEQNRKDPFFLMVSWTPPHADFLAAPEEKKHLYPDPTSLPFRGNVPSETKTIQDGNRIWEKNSWEYYQGYHAHVSAIDDELKRVLEYIDQAGLIDNTLVVYSSDHGSMLGSHGLGSKRQPYEESVRVPFLCWSPRRLPRGLKVPTLLGTVDIFPTLCGFANITPPRICEGKDLSDAARGERISPVHAQFIMHIDKTHASGGKQHPAPIFRGVRTARYTYAAYPEGPWCLFDNREDPLQINNLIDSPNHRTIKTRLHAEMKKLMRHACDPLTKTI